MMLLRWAVVLVFAALIARPAAAQPDLIALKVQVLPFLSFAPHFIAEAEGYFEQQGLAVEYVRLASVADALPGILSGELDVIGGILNAGLFNAIGRSGAIQVVADKGSMPAEACAPQSILARSALFEGDALTDIEQVRTLTHNQANPTTYSGFILDRFLDTEFGLSIDDLPGRPIDDVLLNESLGAGSLDLAVISEPFASQLVEDGTGAVWIGGSAVLPDYTYAYIAYGDKLLNQMPDVGERFMIAYLQGVRQYNEGKTERNLDILEAALSLDRAVLDRACFPSIRDDGAMDVDGMVVFQEWLLARGSIDAVIAPEALYDPRFIEAANAALEDI
ncbi:MAG: ABC transporter substrate-binding protein [Chloroflexota bacterium]|nr:ABC transporter substrate-binding protein [Chloroflexota bacterium]